jgi:hypothetical protein
MWVQLLAAKHLDQNGRVQTFYRGDWVEVGKQKALQWINDGEAAIGSGESIALPDSCGAAIVRDLPPTAQPFGGLDLRWVSVPNPAIRFDRTLIWDGLVSLRLDLLATGFGFLDTWDVAIPLVDYALMACDIGNENQRAQTEKIIHDLRVLVYDPRVLFIRRSEAAHSLIEAWGELAPGGGDDRLNLLQALYVTRPKVLALPPTWRREREGRRR